jgi:hypothetical protein
VENAMSEAFDETRMPPRRRHARGACPPGLKRLALRIKASPIPPPPGTFDADILEALNEESEDDQE